MDHHFAYEYWPCIFVHPPWNPCSESCAHHIMVFYRSWLRIVQGWGRWKTVSLPLTCVTLVCDAQSLTVHQNVPPGRKGDRQALGTRTQQCEGWTFLTGERSRTWMVQNIYWEVILLVWVTAFWAVSLFWCAYLMIQVAPDMQER